MKYLWHCRGCNEKGAQEVTMEMLIKMRKDESLIVLLQNNVTHECPNKNIGVHTINDS